MNENNFVDEALTSALQKLETYKYVKTYKLKTLNQLKRAYADSRKEYEASVDNFVSLVANKDGFELKIKTMY